MDLFFGKVMQSGIGEVKRYLDMEDSKNENNKLNTKSPESRFLDLVNVGEMNKNRKMEKTGITVETKKPRKGMNFIKQKIEIDMHVKDVYKIGKKICVIDIQNSQDKIAISQYKKQQNYIEGKIMHDQTNNEMLIERYIKERRDSNYIKIRHCKLEKDKKAWSQNKTRYPLEEKKEEVAKTKNNTKKLQIMK